MADRGRLHGLTILWGFVAPQLLLLVLNWHGWTLVAGEAQDSERNAAVQFGAFALALLIGNAVAALVSIARRRQLPWYLVVVSLAAHIGYLWMFIFYLSDVIPDTVQPWILREGEVGQYNFALMMPAVFLSLWVLVRRGESKLAPKRTLLFALLSVVAVPTVWYLLVVLIQPGWLGQMHVVAAVLVGTVLVLVFIGALIHLADRSLYRLLLAETPKAYYAIAALFGLVMPVAGLLLNRTIPFPTDFQNLSVYVMAVCNGLILMIRSVPQALQGWLLLIRCASWPFIAYFFLVFLPFLPVSLFAVLAVGLGFLMLTPLVLGVFQTRITRQCFAAARAQLGAPKAVTVAVVGLLMLPSYFTAQALIDRHVVTRTLNFFYSHDYAESTTAPTSREIARSARVLESLRDRKAGAQMPYLSGFYNRIVFGDMVLTDRRIAHVYRLLTGERMPDAQPFLGARPVRAGLNLAPQTDVSIERAELIRKAEGGKWVLDLKLRNHSDTAHSLFRQTFQLPEGVLLSGLKLKIEGEWVDGRIFDRKTALWVFEKITEFRRDPALLHYVSDNAVELRVYPFPANGLREVRIEFTVHPAVIDELSISSKARVEIEPGTRLLFTDGRVSADLTEYLWQRTPYLHLIVDDALQDSENLHAHSTEILNLARELGASEYRITAARLDRSDATAIKPMPESAADISRAIRTLSAPTGGALWVEAALIHSLTDHNRSIDLDRYPVFVVLSDQDWVKENVDGLQLTAYENLNPDTAFWFSLIGGNLAQHCFAASCASNEEVLVFSLDGRLQVFPGRTNTLFDATDISDIEIFSPTKRRFESLSIHGRSSPQTGWRASAEAWLARRQAGRNPAAIESKRGEWLAEAREKQVLLHGTAYIVVEAASQWEILKRKEQQALEAHSGLEFEDEQATSEPAAWLLLLLVIAFVAMRDWRSPGGRRADVVKEPEFAVSSPR